MQPFDFILIFFSFVYSLALTHLFMSATQMIKNRNILIFDWAHGLWMLVAFFTLALNWISLWGLRSLKQISLETMSVAFLVVCGNYFLCSLVSPEIRTKKSCDMHNFHREQGNTYTLVYFVQSGFVIGLVLGIANPLPENWELLSFMLPGVAALASKRSWVQIGAPAVIVITTVVSTLSHFPVITG